MGQIMPIINMPVCMIIYMKVHHRFKDDRTMIYIIYKGMRMYCYHASQFCPRTSSVLVRGRDEKTGLNFTLL